ncbi:AlbA family DNA-binding domain-containing protein [Lunatibacter salilacus]|uniref:AlbA family DNA-binding domain-containing protein n=1 Tax=Lunatibacter salilacus TaxID=2483804 RepID=UPI00131B71A0|nr:ATP-binding protein [Lunatibacter salilacus]
MYSLKKNNDFIKKIISRQEGLQLDFKQNLSSQSKIAKTIVAFANTAGGTIVVGISDNGKLIGIDVEEEKYMVEEAIKNYCVPPVAFMYDIYEIDYWEEKNLPEEKYLLFLEIPKSKAAPHFVQDKQGKLTYYIRSNDQSIPENYL